MAAIFGLPPIGRATDSNHHAVTVLGQHGVVSELKLTKLSQACGQTEVLIDEQVHERAAWGYSARFASRLYGKYVLHLGPKGR